MSPSSTRETYRNVLHEAEVDGGWSGQLRIVVGNNGRGAQDLVFVDSDLLGPRRLVLTASETISLAEALELAANEIIPPYPWDLEAFQSTYGHIAPAEHSRTRADLKRHVRDLSNQHEAAKTSRMSAP